MCDEGEVERQLCERTAEYLNALRAKDEYLASMSHELRTPLTSMLSLTEALLLGMLGPMTEEQRSSLGIIAESGKHLLAVVNDVLDMAKIEAGKLELHLEPLEIIDCCHAAIRLITPTLRNKDLHLTVQVGEDLPILFADEVRVTQILVNLLHNAVKFTPTGGNIGIEVNVDSTTASVKFIVWDTGLGISPEKLPLLFKPFVQLDSHLSRQNTGTGLGLSLVHRIAELHGGHVTVDSTLGAGTRFVVQLPCTSEE